jgi:predicted aspartyl protease
VRLSNAGDVERVRRGQADLADVRAIDVDALVDTGSTRSAIPAALAARLGLTVMTKAIGRLGDGSHVEVDVCSPLGFRIEDRETFEEAYIMGSEVLIGQTVLEATDLLVDCVNRRVIPNPRHPDGPEFRF